MDVRHHAIVALERGYLACDNDTNLMSSQAKGASATNALNTFLPPLCSLAE